MWRNLIFMSLFFLSLGLCGCESEEPMTDFSSDSEAVSEDTNVLEEYDGPELVLACDQKREQVVLYDLSLTELDGNELWYFAPRRGSCNSISGVKYRKNDRFGEVVVLCASGGYAGIVSYPKKEVLWQTDSAGVNPHSVELLPNGNLAVASSSGGTVRVYASSQTGKAASYYTEVALPEAHGVLWDPEREVLWALGGHRLTAWRVNGTDAQPELVSVPDLGGSLPDSASGAHDLAPVYGNSDRLWITADRVMQYSKSTGEFFFNYNGNRVIDRGCSNAIGDLPESGSVITLISDGTYHPWCSGTIGYVRFVPGRDGAWEARYEERVSEICAYYKVRVFCSDYQ